MLLIRIAIRTLSKNARTNSTKLRELHKKAFGPKYLLITNVGISLSLSSFGDFIEQSYEIYSKQIPNWSRSRTIRMAISGVTVGIVCHYWYKMLDNFLKGRTIKTIMKKVVLDQLICSPIYISVFFITLAILENKTWNETTKEIQEKAWKLYSAEWIVWPVAQVINFYFISPKYRVLYDNSISLGYDIFTSKIKYS